jgi:oligo-alginate lyase
MSKSKMLVAIVLCAVGCLAASAHGKEAGVFYPKQVIEKARANAAKYPWAAEQKRLIVEAAKPWARMSDDELWGLMFGPTIHRSWHVLSDGICPSCKKPVPMYSWQMDGLNHPWKVCCPQCKEYFPKNDFGKYYRSGLDEHGIFDAKRADRSLLFNADHPDPKDPLRMFGVDDGTGYIEGGKKWQFISTYLIFGQWKQAVLAGIRNLATAYAVTGDAKYAHKAGVMLDRVADVYPTFDFQTQADLYDGRNQGQGYVSVWHDACEETRELAMGYDMVFDGIKGDKELVEFLAAKSKQYGLENPKASFADIERNIEDRILTDALNNTPKISSNFPRTQIAQMVMKSVLDWQKNREDVMKLFDWTFGEATKADGVTGEKGMTAYSAYAIRGVAMMLAQFSRVDPGFLQEALKRQPRLHDMYRFHIDTMCIDQYYPNIGDSGSFANKYTNYAGVEFSKGYYPSPNMYGFSLSPSMFSFLWDLYKITGDTAFVQALYRGNGNTTNGLPYDLFADDPDALQRDVKHVIERVGLTPKLKSVNKQEWHLAILRSGEGENARALWLDYDAWYSHGHADCMQIGLFAKGLDLLPDFGYKPVQFGGWGASKAVWYGKTASHNTVVVDGKDQENGAGETKLWSDGKVFKAVRASGPTCMGGKQFDRTVASVSISDKDFYVFDVFRVVGGKDHAKFTGSYFGTVTTQGLALKPAPDYGNGAEMRNFQADPAAKPGWSVDWKIEDRYKYLPAGSDVHLRYTDLTEDAQANTAEGWISIGPYNSTEQAWIPRIMVRRQSDKEPLASTFVAVMEPYEKQSSIAGIRRLSLETADGQSYPDSFAAVEVKLADGRRDIIISAGAENPLGLKPARGIMVQKDWNLRTDAELCMIRLSKDGKVEYLSLCDGTFLAVGDRTYETDGTHAGDLTP